MSHHRWHGGAGNTLVPGLPIGPLKDAVNALEFEHADDGIGLGLGTGSDMPVVAHRLDRTLLRQQIGEDEVGLWYDDDALGRCGRWGWDCLASRHADALRPLAMRSGYCLSIEVTAKAHPGIT